MTYKIAAQPRATKPGNDANLDQDLIRRFHVKMPEAALADPRRRIAATKWPERELVTDATQGVQLATIQKLANYWANDYDWRKVEARLNSLPQLIYYNRLTQGGYFAAWEQPQLFAEEIRAAFRPLR